VVNQALLDERRMKDEFFKSHPQSPLTPDQQKQFTSLSYYDPNPDLDLTLEAEEFEDKDVVQMQTSTGDIKVYQKWGKISFEVGSDTAELTLFYSPDHGSFFLPFMDGTSGSETYGAGRYIDPEWLGGNRVHVDFNIVYSPYCAYNDRWNCPIPPMENRLKVRIEAGEKKPDTVWAPSY
jgi:uncharacterized protein (DUF1684 family)